MQPRIVASIAVGFLASGCAETIPVVRLEPQAPDVAYVAGRAVLTQTQKGVRVAAAFDHQEGRSVAFRVEVENDRDVRIDVDPRDIQFVSCVTAQECSPNQPITDPEEMLLQLDQARSREESAARNMATFYSVLILLNATADIAAATRGHSRHAGNGGTALAIVNAESDADASDRTLSRLREQRVTWSTVALRRTTLFPGAGAAGLVYVPLQPEARSIWLAVRVADSRFWFPFGQAVLAPPPHAKESDDEP